MLIAGGSLFLYCPSIHDLLIIMIIMRVEMFFLHLKLRG